MKYSLEMPMDYLEYPMVTHSTQPSLIQEIGGKEKRKKAMKKIKENGKERKSKDNLFPILFEKVLCPK